MPVISELKISLKSIKKFLCISVTHPVLDGSVETVCYIYISLVYVIYVIYLHVIETCLKVIIATFYHCHSKNRSNIMKNISNSISIYS